MAYEKKEEKERDCSCVETAPMKMTMEDEFQ